MDNLLVQILIFYVIYFIFYNIFMNDSINFQKIIFKSLCLNKPDKRPFFYILYFLSTVTQLLARFNPCADKNLNWKKNHQWWLHITCLWEYLKDQPWVSIQINEQPESPRAREGDIPDYLIISSLRQFFRVQWPVIAVAIYRCLSDFR